MASTFAPISLALTTALLLACGNGNGAATDGTTAESTTTDAGTASTTTGTTDVEPTTGAPAGRPNWHEDVAPVVAEHCQGCHIAGGIAPFTMETYEDTRDWAAVMAFDVAEGLMPPWHAVETDACQPPHGFKHDARLSDELKAMFQAWSDNGAPEGDPSLAAPLPTPPSLDLPDPSATAIMASGVTVEKLDNTLDFFNCLSIDPGNETDVFVTGLQLIPGNRKIVHHVLIYVDEAAESAGWANGIKPDCGGSSGLSGKAPLVSGWVPGGLPMEVPADVGIALPAGARLVLNVHYHATGAGPEQDDATGLALRWTTEQPEWVSMFSLLGAPGDGTPLSGPFVIPADTTDHVEEFEWKVTGPGNTDFPDSVEARLWAVAAHMHKVGVDLRVWVEDRDSGAETCLLETPRWDFDWQRVYEVDRPLGDMVRLKSGDTIRVRCVYDNTIQNPGVQEALAEVGLDAPIDVQLGEETLDEMCIGAIGVAVRQP